MSSPHGVVLKTVLGVAITTALLFQTAQAQVCTITNLLRDVAITDNTSPHRYRILPSAALWNVVAVRPQGGDWDLELYAATAPSPTCVSQIAASSRRSVGVDFVLVDYHSVPLATRYPSAVRGSGAAGYQIEWEEGALLHVNSFWQTRDVGPSDIVDIWEIDLVAGVPYRFEFLNSSDCRLMLFRNPGTGPYQTSRAAAIAELVTTGEITVTATKRYAVVVVNETGASGSFALRVANCSGEVRTLGGSAHEAVPSLSFYSFTPTIQAWSAVGLRDAFADWDLYVSGSAASGEFPVCYADLAASSVSTYRTEFVVGDFRAGANPLAEHVVTCSQNPSPTSSGTVKWDGSGQELVVGAPAEQRHTSGVIELWNVQMEAGRPYTIDFVPKATDAQFYLFHNPGGPYWGGRADAVLTGTGATVYTPPSTDVYGLVVVHENSEDDFYSVGICSGNLPSLTSGIGSPTQSPRSYRLRQLRAYWAAAGVRSAASDWNLELRRGACDIGFPLAGTVSNLNQVDFVIGDFNHAPTGDYSVQVSRVTGSSSAIVEWDDGGDQIIPNMVPVTRSTGPQDVLEVWDVFLVAGRTYSFYFPRQGAADTKLFVFQSGGTALYTDRSEALLATQDPYTNFTPSVSDYYGLVVVNDNGAAGNYALSVATAVTDVEPGAAPAATAFRTVAPNPSRGRVRFDFDSREGGPALIDIIDVAGRLVASRSTLVSGPGTSHLEWNGIDARGQEVPAGIYWARLSAAGRAIGTRKFIVLR